MKATMAESSDESVPVFTVEMSDLLLSSMNEKLQKIKCDQRSKAPSTIYRILPSIREEDSGAYDPKMISIGPFHKDKAAFQPMEPLKWRFLNDLINRHPENKLEKYIEEVRSLASNAMTCYSGLVDPISDSFVETLVVDGCFIIEFLIKWNLEDHEDDLYTVNWNLPLLRNDLLLVENQVPFFILQSLFDLSEIPTLISTLEKDCHLALTILALNYLTKGNLEANHEIPHHFHHLLHLYHSTLSPSSCRRSGSASNPCLQPTKQVIKKINNILLSIFFWFLSVVLYCRRPPRVNECTRAPRMIPSATELREAGIVFKKNESRSMLDVTFRDGVMEMPLLSIQAATIPLFRNLIAFEQCCPEAGSHFTCYVALLDNLIDTPGDVLVLEGSGILESKLGDEETVSKFFNSLGSGGYLDYENHYLVGLFKDVKDYYSAESHRWRARLVHDYFSNPWSIISLIAAFVLLVLAAVQSFFAVYSYVLPPGGSPGGTSQSPPPPPPPPPHG